MLIIKGKKKKIKKSKRDHVSFHSLINGKNIIHVFPLKNEILVVHR